ncbi:N-acetyltransferase [Rhizobium sp. Root1220]|uniref:GNAT family N-acetyltransferase n=1 Tax=Rhizobium sp. Root1220 TaxID=1736432 RepID=UPI0006F43994|nr:N-acetyltransferase [Rhizobium sp. Root1220]KQV81382.1 acetyltransferase [Rhizobium sp. Root1220]
MAPFVTLRPATREDAAELAIVADLASHGVACWLWLGELAGSCGDTPMELGRLKMRRDDGYGSWRHAVIAEAYGETAGAAIGYALGDDVRDIEVDRVALQPAVDLQKTVIGSWFIATLGVYSHLRGIGIGKSILDDQIERAGTLPVSLITASDNEAALALYRKNGFSERARRQALSVFESSRKHEWVLLTRDAR